MNNLTLDLLKKYLNSLKLEYSESSFNRKLSSLRRFVRFLKDKGKINDQEANELTDILNIKSASNIEPSIKLPRSGRLGIRSETPKVVSKIDDKNKSKNQGIKGSHFRGPMYAEPNLISHFSLHTSSLTLLVIIFLFFSLNIYILSKMNSNILKRIDAARTIESDAFNESVALNKSITLILTIDAILTDNFGIPLSYEQDVSFAIYPTQTSSTPLYATGICQIKPNDTGRISARLGEDCGQPIPYSLFIQYPELYVGMTIGFGPELIPRLPIKKIKLLNLQPKKAEALDDLRLGLKTTPTPFSFPLFVDENVATETSNIATDSSTMN